MFIFDNIKLILDPRGRGKNVKILIGRLFFSPKKKKNIYWHHHFETLKDKNLKVPQAPSF